VRLCSEPPPKVAVTEFDVPIVTLQLPVPVHDPDQLVKVLPVAGVSLNVTVDPGAKFAEQTAVVAVEQLIPAGVLVTVPVPPPASTTVRLKLPAKLAVTVVAAEMVTTHVLVPVHAPLHPPKENPLPAVAVRVTCVPCAKGAVH
jgi:hypothetical protein